MKTSWQASRTRGGWGSGMAEWYDGETANLSVVFSWNLADAYQRANFLKAQGYRVRAGGPAITLNPQALEGVAEIGGEADALPWHNPNATFTSRGCIRHCPFCIVPKIEGELRELEDWPVKPIVCDNNLLACSLRHFDRVIDRLKGIKDVDFEQGLDARLLTPYHAYRLAELKTRCVRLAWDNVHTETQVMNAIIRLRDAGFSAGHIHVYVLIGFKDTPDDALYRLRTVANLGAYPNPMRYQPVNSERRNAYVDANWTDAELKRYMRYWSNLRITRKIPFEEFRHRGDEPKPPVSEDQLPLL